VAGRDIAAGVGGGVGGVSNRDRRKLCNNLNLNIENTDIYVYSGDINRFGYHAISQYLDGMEDKKKDLLLCLATYGGDPNAAYRIGRCLQHHYPGRVAIYAPSYCKSSGTLLAIATNNLIIGNQGELGPLDIQLQKRDEIFEQSSGLDIFKAVNFLEDRALMELRKYMIDIKAGTGITTKLSAEIATKLTDSIIKPIACQIDPIKIGEHQRAIGIAQEYGFRLNEMTHALQPDALNRLVGGYPSHDFVIDRKEAAELFLEVFAPCDTMIAIFKQIETTIIRNISNNQPFVELFLPSSQDVAEVKEVQHGISSKGQSTSNSPGGQATAEPGVVEKDSRNPKRSRATRARHPQTSHE